MYLRVQLGKTGLDLVPAGQNFEISARVKDRSGFPYVPSAASGNLRGYGFKVCNPVCPFLVYFVLLSV